MKIVIILTNLASKIMAVIDAGSRIHIRYYLSCYLSSKIYCAIGSVSSE